MENYRKLIVHIAAGLVTLAAVLMDGHLIPSNVEPWVIAGIVFAGSYGVYRLPNTQTPTA